MSVEQAITELRRRADLYYGGDHSTVHNTPMIRVPGSRDIADHLRMVAEFLEHPESGFVSVDSIIGAPAEVRREMVNYPDVAEVCFKCECGRWYESMDSLFPYHMEGNRCGVCDEQ